MLNVSFTTKMLNLLFTDNAECVIHIDTVEYFIHRDNAECVIHKNKSKQCSNHRGSSDRGRVQQPPWLLRQRARAATTVAPPTEAFDLLNEVIDRVVQYKNMPLEIHIKANSNKGKRTRSYIAGIHFLGNTNSTYLESITSHRNIHRCSHYAARYTFIQLNDLEQGGVTKLSGCRNNSKMIRTPVLYIERTAF